VKGDCSAIAVGGGDTRNGRENIGQCGGGEAQAQCYSGSSAER